MADLPLLATMTGDHFQPVRLHYRILDRAKLTRAFKALQCLDHDAVQKRWVWLYAHEAKKLRFKNSYSQIAKQFHPIVIGSFFLRGEDVLLLDLRSIERALSALPFFESHLPRRVVEVSSAEIVNRLFPATEANLKLSPDVLFDRQTTPLIDPEAVVRRITELVSGVENPREKIKLAMADLNARSGEPLPEIERIPVHFAEDGIVGFRLALRLRQLVAFEHWNGNPGFTLQDAIQATIHRTLRS